MSENSNNPEESYLTIKKNDYILIVVENLSLGDIKTAGIIFVAMYILVYVGLLVWAHFKDQQKQTYSSKVSDLSYTHSQIAMPRRPNFRAMQIDITSDTLDFTNQSVRMNFDDQKDISTILQGAGQDGFSVISPMHRPDSMSVSPVHQGGKKAKFNLLRTPPRSFQKIDLDATSPSAIVTGQEELMTTNKDEPAPSKEDTTKDDAITRKEMSHIIEDLTKDDEFLNQSAQKKRPAKAKKENKAAKITKNRQTIKSKFLKLLSQRHAIWSTVQRMSRIFPRYKRVSLLYFLFSCNLFLLTISFINSSIFELLFWQLFKLSAFNWVLFITFSWLSSVSKDGLKHAKTMEEFQSTLANLEKEAKYKDIGVHIIIGLFSVCAFSQYALFITVKWQYTLQWIAYSILVFMIQMVFFDAFWELIIAYLYTKAYDSKGMKRLYRRLNSIRFWRV